MIGGCISLTNVSSLIWKCRKRGEKMGRKNKGKAMSEGKVVDEKNVVNVESTAKEEKIESTVDGENTENVKGAEGIEGEKNLNQEKASTDAGDAENKTQEYSVYEAVKQKYGNVVTDKKQSRVKQMLVLTTILAIAFAISTFVLMLQGPEVQTDGRVGDSNIVEITREFYIPPLDLRGYELDHFEVEQWFLERINYHREAYGLHPYELYLPATITSIEHSLDMRNNEFGGIEASDGRTHQQRHDRWFGVYRTKVTSAHASNHELEPGPLTREGVNEIVDRIVVRERTRDFLMNPTYYYIGIGFSVQADGRGRLSITMASQPDERAAHRARTPEEREIHRQEYLERVREERGWTGEY